jgi:hypothetical protein
MVSSLGAYFAYSHYLIAIDADWVFEAVAVPELK